MTQEQQEETARKLREEICRSLFGAEEEKVNPSEPCEIVKKIREELNKHPKQAGGLIRFTYWGGEEKGGTGGEH